MISCPRHAAFTVIDNSFAAERTVLHARSLIIGGGPAGSSAAITLARAGMTPVLVERQATARDGVCGGFLGWDALAVLDRLGIDPWLLGARPISHVRLIARSRIVEARLPNRAAGMSRRTLDTALADAAQAVGATILRGHSARTADSAARSIWLDDGRKISADGLFLATGKHELRGLSRNAGGASVGLRATLPPDIHRSDALQDRVELHLFDNGYAGLLLQEDGSTNLCLSVSRHRLSATGSVAALLDALLRQTPMLADRLQGHTPQHFDAVAGIPYGWRAQAGQAGIFRLGDQAAVIASLAGDGIAIALTSGASAARAMIEGGPEAAIDWQRAFSRRCRQPLWIADALRHGAAFPTTRGLFMQLLRLVPGLATQAATMTRIVPT